MGTKGQITYSEEKFAELLLYVAIRSEDDPDFGRTKLHKILYFCDFTAFAELGASITGARYQKLQHGPTARPMVPVVQDLERRGDAKEREIELGRFTQKRLMALRDPRVSLFTGPEIALVDAVIARLRGKDAATLSRETHDHDGWRLSAMNEDIPYCAALLPRGPAGDGSPVELTEAEMAYGRETIARMAAAQA